MISAGWDFVRPGLDATDATDATNAKGQNPKVIPWHLPSPDGGEQLDRTWRLRINDRASSIIEHPIQNQRAENGMRMAKIAIDFKYQQMLFRCCSTLFCTCWRNWGVECAEIATSNYNYFTSGVR